MDQKVFFDTSAVWTADAAHGIVSLDRWDSHLEMTLRGPASSLLRNFQRTLDASSRTLTPEEIRSVKENFLSALVSVSGGWPQDGR